MRGALLDTHALYWLVGGQDDLSEASFALIGQCQETKSLFLSSISAWELSVAAGKRKAENRPDFGDNTPERWFRNTVRSTAARVISIDRRISFEAARVVTDTGHRDPGDCFLISTARVRRLCLVTRDATLHAIAARLPGYLDVIAC